MKWSDLEKEEYEGIPYTGRIALEQAKKGVSKYEINKEETERAKEVIEVMNGYLDEMED